MPILKHASLGTQLGNSCVSPRRVPPRLQHLVLGLCTELGHFVNCLMDTNCTDLSSWTVVELARLPRISEVTACSWPHFIIFEAFLFFYWGFRLF